MPVYNVADYITESIESVIDQEYNNWELIVINDGSTDRTADIVYELMRKDSRVFLYDQENQGVSAARNRGIQVANGKYVAFLDGDDLWDASFLSKVVSAIESNEVDMVFSDYQYMDVHRRIKKARPKYKYADGNILLPYLQGMVRISIAATIANKDFLYNHNLWFTEGCTMGEDGEFILKLLGIAKVYSVREELMTYRMRLGSARNSGFDWQKRFQRVAALKRALLYLQEHCNNILATEETLKAFEAHMAKNRYRLLWRMIKHGNHLEALQMLTEPDCIYELNQINLAGLRLTNRLQYHIIISKKTYLWKICTLKCIMARQNVLCKIFSRRQRK